MITVQVNENDMRAVREALKAIGEKPDSEIKKAVNRVAKETKKQIYLNSLMEYTIKRGAYNQGNLNMKSATISNLRAVIDISGEAPGLKKGYLVRRNGKRMAAQTAVKRNSHLKLLDRGGKKAFVVSMTNSSDSSHDGIFQRNNKEMIKPGSKSKSAYGEKLKKRKFGVRGGKKPEAIKELFGPGPGKIAERVVDNMHDTIGERLLNEMIQAVSQLGGGR